MKKLICLFKGHRWKRCEDAAYNNCGPSMETCYVPQCRCTRCGTTKEIGDGDFTWMFGNPFKDV